MRLERYLCMGGWTPIDALCKSVEAWERAESLTAYGSRFVLRHTAVSLEKN